MCPNPIPNEPGYLSVLKHRGSFGPSLLNLQPYQTSIFGIPILGTVGTNDPAIWHHVIWWAGKAYEAELKSDIPGHHTSLTSLMCHFERHPEMWSPVAPVISP